MVLRIYICSLGLTIFIVHEIARDRTASTMLEIARDGVTITMLKTALGSFAVEFIGLSTVYYWIIFYSVNEKWYRQYLILFTFRMTILGFLTAIVPFLIDLKYRVDWELVL